jgi:hypothetical protein
MSCMYNINNVMVLVVCLLVAVMSLNVGVLAAREGIYDTTGVAMLDDITFPKAVPNDKYNVLVLVCLIFP